MKIGILTSGGDCPGLNAVIRSIVLSAERRFRNLEIVGIPDGYAGLIEGESRPLCGEDVQDLLMQGGTVLGSKRRPYKMMTVVEDGTTRLGKMCENYRKMGLDCLFTLGGAGTHKTAALLCAEGCRVIGVPKTIDNDIFGTEVTFGFQSAADIASDALIRIRSTAASHGRTILLELMGNKVGWLTLHAGISAGADVILIPEIPFSLDALAEQVAENAARNPCTVIAVAEGAVLADEIPFRKRERVFVRRERGESTVTPHLAEELAARTHLETRYNVLGYLQRGGSPCAYDRLLSTRLGRYVVQLASEGNFGVTAAVHRNEITYNALAEIAGKTKAVDPSGELVRCARDIGIAFGDSASRTGEKTGGLL